MGQGGSASPRSRILDRLFADGSIAVSLASGLVELVGELDELADPCRTSRGIDDLHNQRRLGRGVVLW